MKDTNYSKPIREYGLYMSKNMGGASIDQRGLHTPVIYTLALLKKAFPTPKFINVIFQSLEILIAVHFVFSFFRTHAPPMSINCYILL